MPEPLDLTLALVRDLTVGFRRPFAVRTWDGSELPAETDVPKCTIVLEHPGALRALLLPPTQLTMAEAYIFGDVDVEGDIEAVFGFADHLLARRWPLLERARLARTLLQLPAERRARRELTPRLSGRRFSLARDRQAVTAHYDLSNDFFALYLDRRMVYTCAYFSDADDELDDAQLRKLDLLCRKLRLRPGERMLDIGCGWGGLLLHAAEHYDVDAVGITLSAPQAELARERISSAGLEHKVHVEVMDYRELDEPESYDKVVSVCMFEAVGESLLPHFFALARRLLKPGGVFLNQGIAAAMDFQRTARRGPSFMDRYVFPDGGVVPVSAALRAAELAGFEVRDVESLREHYVLTLREWVRRLEANHEEAVRLVDEHAYRVWRLYMAGAAYAMERGRLNVYQALFAKPDAAGATGLPLTRADWYSSILEPEYAERPRAGVGT
jgi:cyclopropane-fatty-acyl-phospholipid synthase